MEGSSIRSKILIDVAMVTTAKFYKVKCVVMVKMVSSREMVTLAVEIFRTTRMEINFVYVARCTTSKFKVNFLSERWCDIAFWE